MGVLQEGFGDRVYKILPKPLKPVKPIPYFASAYHFKWIRGVAAKLERRAKTEVYTNGQYDNMRTLLDMGHILNQDAIKRLCGCNGCPSASSEPRGLSARELTMIFLNIKNEYLDAVVESIGVDTAHQDTLIAEILQKNIHTNIARET